jgi:hypothetical protein
MFTESICSEVSKIGNLFFARTFGLQVPQHDVLHIVAQLYKVPHGILPLSSV